MKFKFNKLTNLGMTLGAGLVLLIGLYADIFGAVASLFDIMASGGEDTEKK